MTPTWPVGLAALVATGLVLAGCSDGATTEPDSKGFAAQAPSEIVAAAVTDMRVLGSMRVTLPQPSDGERPGLDLLLSKRGACSGFVEVDGVAIEVRGIGGVRWLRTPETDGMWVSFQAVDLPVSALCDTDLFVDSFDSGADVRKGEAGRIDGVDVVEVELGGDGDQSTRLSVLAESPHYVVRLEVADGESVVTISDFEEHFEVAAPTRDEIADPATIRRLRARLATGT
jgi:hypothetical protein